MWSGNVISLSLTLNFVPENLHLRRSSGDFFALHHIMVKVLHFTLALIWCLKEYCGEADRVSNFFFLRSLLLGSHYWHKMRRRGRRKLILRSINCIVDFPQGYWFSWMNWRPYSLDKDVYKGSSNIVNDNNFGYVLIDLRRPLEWPHKIALFLRLFGRCHLNILWPNLTSFVTMRGRKRLRSFEATSIVAFSGLNSWILSLFFFSPC